jgi:hypothetical protein
MAILFLIIMHLRRAAMALRLAAHVLLFLAKAALLRAMISILRLLIIIALRRRMAIILALLMAIALLRAAALAHPQRRTMTRLLRTTRPLLFLAATLAK